MIMTKHMFLVKLQPYLVFFAKRFNVFLASFIFPTFNMKIGDFGSQKLISR